jgi:hypothetical protein
MMDDVYAHRAILSTRLFLLSGVVVLSDKQAHSMQSSAARQSR